MRPGRVEAELVRALLDQLLREDVGGLRSAGVLYRRGRRAELMLAAGPVRLPVRPGDPAGGDLLADLVVREPWLDLVGARRRARVRRLPAVLNALRTRLPGGPDPELAAGWLDLRVEAVAALCAATARRKAEPAVRGSVREGGSEQYETLAAFDDHPLHPLSAARVGMPARDLPRFAPEHRARVVPRWVRVPAETAEVHGELPSWWPVLAGEVAVPVHPGTDPALLPAHARPLALPPGPDAGGPATLSMRTLAVEAEPGCYLKLPLPVRTLGRLNLRRLDRAGLHDGGLVQHLLNAVLAREPTWAPRVSVADEATWVWAGDPMLAALVRRLPVAGRGELRLPVAALAARGTSGRPVAVELAGSLWDGDLVAMLGDYLDAVLGWHLRLWLRYGIALEAHPQNVCLRIRPDPSRAGRPRLDLLMRDLDSGRLDLAALAVALPEIAPTRDDLGDPRLAAADPRELADLVLTTTLHQCVAAVLIRLARRTGQPAGPLLGLVPGRLLAIGRALGGGQRIESVVAATRLPVKCSITAATLLPKHRTGRPGVHSDVNKYYAADAPSYLPATEPTRDEPTRDEPTRDEPTWAGPDPGEVTAAALISCLTREIAGPFGAAGLVAGRLRLDLVGEQRLEVSARGLTAAVARPHGPVLLSTAQGTRTLDWYSLARLVARQLGSGPAGPARAAEGLAGQVRASHDLIAAAAARRADRPVPTPDGYLASEQSLLSGHRHHPAPKARSGRLPEALEFAPEVGASFCLHHLAVAGNRAWQRQAEAGEPGLLDTLVADDVQVPPGYLALPAHPWQVRLLRRDPGTRAALAAALASGALLDLGPGRVQWSPTASVRTLVRPDVDAFLKVGLSVRITNCVRVNPRVELAAAVRLSDHLAPVVADLRASSPGLEVLLEPAARSLDEAGLGDVLGVLARTGLPRRLPDGGRARPVLAAALVEPAPIPQVADLLARITRDHGGTLRWWRGYLDRLLPPVLRALLVHGVAFEAHLQNVVLLLDRDDQVGGVVLRDLEGTKLLAGQEFPQRNADLLAALPVAAGEHLHYPHRLGWNRVAYCLLVNQVATLLGAIVDSGAGGQRLEAAMWAEVTGRLESVLAELGDLPGAPLAELLAGGPAPAKANLLTRWHDLADRDSGYVPVQLPIRSPG